MRNAWPRSLATGMGVLAIGSASAAEPSGWDSYANARFAYHICYPADRLNPLPEADNGDGRRFAGANGAGMAVWGLFNAMDQSLKAAHDAYRAAFYRARYTVSYDRSGPDWFVLSGTKGRQIFYRKTLLVGDRWLSMELRYPASDKAKWAAVTERIAQCLRPLPERDRP